MPTSDAFDKRGFAGEPEEAEAVHLWFGLTYCNYLVLPRTLLQSMPSVWQRRFVGCLEELYEAFAHVDQAEGYVVKPAVERIVEDLSDEELAAVGYSKSDDECGCYMTMDPVTGKTVSVPARCPHEVTYYDDEDREVSADSRVMVPVGRDPVPHYNRGRTRIEPRAQEVTG